LRSTSAAYAIAAAVCERARRPDDARANPKSPNPQAKPGATIVINPTEDACQKGWNSCLQWTKEQFDQFCTRLKAAK
jgi:hypothetical protein